MRFRFVAILPLLTALAFADPALALPPGAAGAHAPAQAMSIADRARAFAAKYNLPIRTVQVKVEGREATRIFMPVTEATHGAFVEEFTNGGAVIRQRQADQEHVTMALSPNDLIHNWGQPGPMFEPSQGGRYVALDLDPVEKVHFKATVQNAQNTQFMGKNGSANCTRWLVNGCIGPDRPLAHKFGIKRANAPSNLIKKLIHAGNDQVVIGIAMSNDPAATQQLRQQLQNYDEAIGRLEAQIEQLEVQGGGGRIKAFRAETDPYHDALRQLDGIIALRQGQPLISAALKTKKHDIEQALKDLTAQHEAPYHQRVAALKNEITTHRTRVKQLETARDAAVKIAADQLAAREHEAAELAKLIAPAQGKATRYDKKLFEIDQGIRELKIQTAQAKTQRAALRAQQRTQLAQAKVEFRALLKQARNKPGAPGGNANAFQQRVAQLDQQLDGVRKNIAANPNSGRVPYWLQQVKELVTEREAIVETGPLNYNPQYAQRIATLEQSIMQFKLAIAQHANTPAQRGNIHSWRATIEQFEMHVGALKKAGPLRYDASYDQQLQRVTGRIQQYRALLSDFDLQDEQSETALHQQLAERHKERDAIVQKGRDHYHPEYDAELARLDAQINQHQAQITQYERAPAYAHHVASWRTQMEALQRKKDELRAQPPLDYNPQYEQRIAQLDATIKQTEANLQHYRASPAYAQHAVQAEKTLLQQQELKQSITNMGPRLWDPQLEQKMTNSVNATAQAKTNLENVQKQHRATIDAAKDPLGRTESLFAEITRHGALKYNQAYEQRFAQLDSSIAQLEAQIRQYADHPAYAQHRAQWQAQIDAHRATRDDVTTKGPENYNPNEPQIQKIRQQVVQHSNAAAPIRAQVAAADAAANAGNELAAKFAAIPEPDLMGVPPGGGAAEAVRK